MYATFLQWWRLGNLKNKLSGTLNPENALLVCDESIIFNTRRNRSIENLLFRCDNRLGVTVVPKVYYMFWWRISVQQKKICFLNCFQQKINLCSQWLYFPKDYRYFPIFFKPTRVTLSSPNVYVLVQTVLESYKRHQAEVLPVSSVIKQLRVFKIQILFKCR